jgi:very-short-patch-repair endonuclease
MKCLKCDKELKCINNTHLLKCSKITVKEYLKEFPDAIYIDPNVVKSYSGDRNGNWKGGRTKRLCEICNNKLHKNAKGERCKNCFSWENIGGNPFLGKKHSAETKEKFKISASLRDKSTYKSGKAPFDVISKNTKKWWSSLTDEQKNKKLAPFIKAGLKACKKSAKTKIENIIDVFLSPLKIEYKRNEQIGIFNVDFLIPSKNLVIECFGDYWHCNPKLYNEDFYNKSLKMTAKEKWDKDKKRVDFLTSLGYTVITFWGEDIKNSLNDVKEKIYVYL